MRNKIPGIISTCWVILNILSIVPINNADTIPTKNWNYRTKMDIISYFLDIITTIWIFPFFGKRLVNSMRWSVTFMWLLFLRLWILSFIFRILFLLLIKKSQKIGSFSFILGSNSSTFEVLIPVLLKVSMK